MSSDPLAHFLDECRAVTKEFVQPADIVLECAPLMQELLTQVGSFLADEHTQGCDDHYARNLVHAEDDGSLSLFTMVWQPGQWTPVHDHGTWGIVGIVKGSLMERNMIRTDPCEREDHGIILRRGGVSVLGAGSVVTLVPNPAHIHRTGVPRSGKRAITLHLYGRHMNNYNVYDLELQRRTPVEVPSDNEPLV